MKQNRITIQDDFFKKYPKAKKDRSGCPVACAECLGYVQNVKCSQTTCKDCWQTLYREKKQ